MLLKRLRRKRNRRILGRNRQLDYWERTGELPHLRAARVHGRAARYIQSVIRRLRTPGPVSPKLLAFIQHFEGYYAEPYNDPVGYATVGTGHLIGYRPVREADRHDYWLPDQRTPGRLTPREARKLLRRDLVRDYEPAVQALFAKGGPLYGGYTQYRYDALVSFVYNLGAGAVGSAPGFETLQAAIQDKDVEGIGDALLLYDRSNGQRLPGLVRRREAERAMFLYGTYDIG